jgi:hypothetical protein
MSELLVRAFPVLPGKEDHLRQFAREVSTTRAADVADFYHRVGIARESWHLQETPQGTWVIAVTQMEMGDTPLDVAAAGYAASQHGFDRWFKDQVKTLSGVDPEAAPLGPPTQCIFDSVSPGARPTQG